MTCYRQRDFVAKQENAAQRLLRRIGERLDADRDKPRAYRKTQRGLAKALGVADSSLSELLDSTSKRGALAHLDKIAEYFNVPPSLLVHGNDTDLMELKPNEYRLIEHYREFPPDVQETISAMFDYFSDLLPEEKAQRSIWTRWRFLSPKGQARMNRLLEAAYREALAEKRATRDRAAAQEKLPETAESAGTLRRRDEG